MVSFFFQIIGASVRYITSAIYYKMIDKNSKSFNDFFKDKNNDVLYNSTNDYINGFIGFITFSVLLILAYLLLG